MTRPVVAVFIGGPWHLHQVALTDAARYYEVPVFRATAAGPWLPRHYPAPDTTFATARYELFKLPNPARGYDGPPTDYYFIYLFEGVR